MANIELPRNSLTAWSPDVMPTPGSAFALLDHLLDSVTGADRPAPRLPLDMVETDTHLQLDIALPGVHPEQLEVHVEGRTLALRGRYTPHSTQGRRTWIRTLPNGDFQYTLTLPVKVETDHIDATLDAGMLHLTLPKAPEAQTRKIEVKHLKANPVKTIG